MILESLPTSLIEINNLTSFIDLNQQFYDLDFTLGQFLAFLVIFFFGVLFTILLPILFGKYLSEYLASVDKKSFKEYGASEELKEAEKQRSQVLQSEIKSTLIKPLQNVIAIIVFASFSLLALYALGYSFNTPFNYDGYDFTLRQIIIFIIVVFIFTLFINTTLSPLIRVILYVMVGRSIKRTDLNAIHKSLVGPFTYVFILVMIYSAIILAFPNYTNLPYYGIFQGIMELLAAVIGVYFVISIILNVFHIEFSLKRKMDRHAAVALANLIKVIGFLSAIFIVIALFGVSSETMNSLALVFAGISFAIAFGMQNMIANIMAGFALAADKPFKIGDRIRVGPPGRETWGDVTDIGLNTTKIRTVEEEYVVIPNNYIASNEVWNFTKMSPIIALTFHVNISYGSNWRLAKKLIIEEALKHAHVLRKPQPIVWIEEFAEASLKMKIWVWIRNALDKDQIRSDLLEAIKDRFDAEGVEIPFPYRTVVYKNDLPKEKSLPIGVKFDNVRWYPSKGRAYTEVGEGPLKGIPVSKVVHEEDVKILTPVSGTHNAKRLAEYSMSLARKINGNVTAIFITDTESKEREMNGLKALSIFEKYGTKFNVNVATRIESGNVVEKILEVIDKDRINLVVIGGGRKAMLGKWGRDSIANEIIERSTVPVVTMPIKLKWY